MTRNINEKVNIASSTDLYSLVFNREGSQCIIYSQKTVHVIQFEIKPDLSAKINGFISNNTVNKNTKEMIPNNSVDISSVAEKEWFQRQLGFAAIQENEKYKPIKTEIESELSLLRTKILGMICENGEVDELEKLDNQEFNLDQEAAEEFGEKVELEIKKLKESVEHQKKQYGEMVKTITEACWSSLETGPRTIKVKTKKKSKNVIKWGFWFSKLILAKKLKFR